MSLSVLIGADCLAGSRSGIFRVTEQIARAASRDPRIAEVRLRIGTAVCGVSALDQALAPAPASVLRQIVAQVPGAAPLLRALRRPALTRAIRHMPAPTVYYEPNPIPRPFAGPIVTTIHDCAFRELPDTVPRERRAYLERHWPAALRAATRITAVSDFTRTRAIETLGVDPGRIVTVPNAAGIAFRPHGVAEAQPVLAGFGLSDRSYILGVSTLEPRKNFDGLLAAYLLLPAGQRAHTPLVIAGAAGWGTTLTGPAAHGAIARGELRLLGFVPDPALAALYARASCLAFVSHYEGFGLPVLEAMASGTPVVASGTTGTGEVAGDAAWRVEPSDPHAIAAGLAAVLGDAGLADDLRRRGLVRAGQFTIPAMMDGMIGVWQAAAGWVNAGPPPICRP